MQVKLQLPCTPLVKHYLESNFGTPAVLTKRSLAGKFFYRLLVKPNQKDNKKYSGYTSTCMVCITPDALHRFGCELSLNDIMEFNQFVTKQVYGLMAVTMDVLQETMPDFNIQKGISFFCSKYDFPHEAMSMDAAIKAYYRYRQAQIFDLQPKKSFGESVRTI